MARRLDPNQVPLFGNPKEENKGVRTTKKASEVGNTLNPFSPVNGARWVKFKLADITVDDARDALDFARDILNGVLTALDVVRSFAELLSLVEFLVSDTLSAIVQAAANELQQTLDNAKATGVYFLDLYTPFRNKDGEAFIQCLRDIGALGKTLDGNSPTDEQINAATKSLIENYGYLFSDANEPFPANASPQEIENIRTNTRRMNQEAFKRKLAVASLSGNNPFGKSDANAAIQTSLVERALLETATALGDFSPVKAQTYEEFIQVVIDAFNDIDDVPANNLLLRKAAREITGSKSLDNSIKNAQIKIARDKQADSDEEKVAKRETQSFFQSGRPNFGPGSELYVYLLAVALPDPRELIFLFYQLSEAFISLGDVAEDFKRIEYLREPELPSGFGFDLDLDRSGSGAKEPNFVGLTAYQILPELFDTLDALVKSLRGLRPRVRTGLADTIIAIVNAIEAEVLRINDIINQIDRILEIIEVILNSGLLLLKVNSSNGNADAVRALGDATGFPLQNTDQRQFIAGFLFAVGYPNPANRDFSFTEEIASIQAQSNDDIASIINQTQGQINILQSLFGGE